MSISEIEMMGQSYGVLYTSKKNETIFSVLIGLAYLYGVLSPQHYSPSVLDLYISLGVAVTICFGTLFFLITNEQKHGSE